jgi:hypothetical protein
MTPEHVIFIPGVLMIGIVLGYVFGSRAVRAEMMKKQRRARE